MYSYGQDLPVIKNTFVQLYYYFYTMDEIWIALTNSFGTNLSTDNIHAHFGVSIETICILWIYLYNYAIVMGIQAQHLLWALHFLKTYNTCRTAAKFWNVNVKTYRFWIWKVIIGLFLCLHQV
jgi:hypothetical protein